MPSQDTDALLDPSFMDGSAALLSPQEVASEPAKGGIDQMPATGTSSDDGSYAPDDKDIATDVRGYFEAPDSACPVERRYGADALQEQPASAQLPLLQAQSSAMDSIGAVATFASSGDMTMAAPDEHQRSRTPPELQPSTNVAVGALGPISDTDPSNHPIGMPNEDEDDEYKTITDEEALVRSMQTPRILQWQPAANGHTGAITSLTYSHNSTMLATGSDDTSIAIWNTSNQTIVRKWDAHTDVVWELAFCLDNKRLASAGADSNVMVWSVETGECLATMTGHEETIHGMAWSAHGKYIASGSDDMSVRLWDADTYEQKTVLEGHEAMVTFVRFSHNSRWLASGAADYCGRLWDVEAGTPHVVLRGHRGMLWNADFDADDRRLVTCSNDGSARVWSVETGEMLVNIHEHQDPVWSVAFSPGGTRVLTASSDSTVRLCMSSTGRGKFVLSGHESMVNMHTTCFSPDGKYVASASCDNTARLWRVDDGEFLATFNEHDDKVTLVGDTLASRSDDGTVRIRLVNEWDPDRAEQDDNDDEDECEEENGPDKEQAGEPSVGQATGKA